MPELPEVEIIRRGLNRLLPGRRIVSVTHDTPKSFPNAKADVEQFLIGATVKDVRRRAKVLIIELDSKYSLVIHLKMTGQLVYVKEQFSHKGEGRFGAGHPNSSLVGKLPDKSTRVTFTLDNSAQLFFNDQRKFGWIRLIPTAEVTNIDFFKKIGPEPLTSDFTSRAFRERLLKRPNTSIKAALLDQSVIAGVGNIYADESLWGAKIHPTTFVRAVSKQKLNDLYNKLRYVLELSIKKGGSTDRNYVDSAGKKGSYLNFARVFRREDLDCQRCGTTIAKLRVAGRGTHICPNCQKPKKVKP